MSATASSPSTPVSSSTTLPSNTSGAAHHPSSPANHLNQNQPQTQNHNQTPPAVNTQLSTSTPDPAVINNTTSDQSLLTGLVSVWKRFCKVLKSEKFPSWNSIVVTIVLSVVAIYIAQKAYEATEYANTATFVGDCRDRQVNIIHDTEG